MDDDRSTDDGADLPGIVHGQLAAAETAPTVGETFTEMVTVGGVRIEAIHSSSSPDPERYCQDHDEWVMVLDGSAELKTAGRIRAMGAGDWVLIGAGVEHRVVSTKHGTRWIAVHLPANDPG